MFNFKSASRMYIITESDSVYYNGDHNEAQIVKLRGKIVLNNSKRENSTIYLTFTTTLTQRSNGIFSSNYEHVLYKHDIKLHFKVNSNNLSNNIVHPFEIQLPGNLPTSLNLDTFSIKHELKAYQKHKFGQSILSTKIINVYRLPHLNSCDYILKHSSNIERLVTNNGFIEDKASYSINYPEICYDFDNSKNIEISIEPTHDYSITSITYSIKQTVELDNLVESGLECQSRYNYQLNSIELYNTNNLLSPQLSPSPPIVKNYRENKPYEEKKSRKLAIKSKFITCNQNQKKYSQLTTFNEEFKIFHFVLIQLILINLSNDELCYELIKLPVIFLSKPKFQNSRNFENDKLPSYDEVLEN